ncbi:glycerate kinase [Sphingobacteriales bacterium UPWRP_1]|nr:glycerate kinase [Sphingobacteriales bacterium UPWRP_1]
MAFNILIAPDSFKNALSAPEAANAIARGVWRVSGEVNPILLPLSDGGEGITDILTQCLHGSFIETTVCNPLFKPVVARYGLIGNSKTAVIELAQASGLQLLLPAQRNPLHTSTFGTGQLLLHAIENGARNLILGIGGSATNDAGIGMAAAMGYRFLDAQGNELKPVGSNLANICQIDNSQLRFNPAQVQVTLACDVTNPLYGPTGAAYTYARQKGASAEEINLLDAGLRQFAKVVQQQYGTDISQIPGAGAAGGTGAGALVFLGANMQRGIDLVMQYTRFEEHLQQAHLLITAEGSIDSQTLYGKVVKGAAQKARKYGVPAVGLCGQLLATPQQLQDAWLTAAFSIQQMPCTLEQAIENTAQNLELLAEQVVRLWLSMPYN